MQGGSPGRVVSGEDSWQEVVGWNPSTGYLMDFFALICCCRNCIVCLKTMKKRLAWPFQKTVQCFETELCPFVMFSIVDAELLPTAEVFED